jgi:hypothetical protein
MPTYDDAKVQWQDLFRSQAGRDPNSEDFNDFENKWRKTPEFQTSEVERTGNWEAGYTTPHSGQRDWQSLMAETGRDLTERFTDKPQNGGPQSPTQAWNSQPAQDPRSAELYSLLMQRAQQGTAVDRNDPNIRAQVDPAVAQMERSSRTYLDQLAEKSGPLANLQGERRMASERQGQAAGQLEGEVIGREIDARRQEIQQALTLWGAQLSGDQRLALERELGYLNDAGRTADREAGVGVSMAGLNQSQDQFLRELALREFDTTNKWDYAWQTGG